MSYIELVAHLRSNVLHHRILTLSIVTYMILSYLILLQKSANYAEHILFLKYNYTLYK